MVNRIVVATNNKNKVEEISLKLTNSGIQLLTLADINCWSKLPEEYETIEQNACQKAWFVYNEYGMDCIADDTGLEVEALGGKPGVYSARYCLDEFPNIDENQYSQYNIAKLLRQMKNQKNRRACFRTIICLIENGKERLFEGKVCGQIAYEPIGNKGFGYDPIFIPDGYNQTFAQMDLTEKNKISHRGQAIDKMVKYLLNKSK